MDGPVRCGSTVQGMRVLWSTSVTQMYFILCFLKQLYAEQRELTYLCMFFLLSLVRRRNKNFEPFQRLQNIVY
jgi:hypothetical protein